MPEPRPEGEPQSERQGRVRRLPEDLANQIAAGEVVERPASAVKELVENAIDAGASRISVELEDGGLALLRITDDGCGMGREDATLCIERHATSKLSGRDQLFAIDTLGFRGEALPSIASVSRFELVTKPHGQLGGTRVVVEGGSLRTVEEAGAAPGTSVTVRDLFYNTPARLKFLKTRQTELKQVQETLQRVALANPGVAFSLSHNDRPLLDLPSGQSLADRIWLLLGEEDAEMMHPMEPATQDGVVASGYFGQPALTRRTTSGLMTFVNGRFVRDRSIHGAIRVAYQGLIDRGRHPVVVLFVEAPPHTVDVNVHPMKTEVRFHEAGSVFRAVRRAIHQSLAAAPWIPHGGQPGVGEPPVREERSPTRNPFRDAESSTGEEHAAAARLPFRGEGVRTYTLGASAPAAPDAPRRSGAGGAFPSGRGAVPEAPPPKSDISSTGRQFFSSLHWIGHFRGTYLLATDGEALIIVDQHAAHERITYENLRRAWKDRVIESQPLLFPERLRFDSLRAALLEESLPFFEQLGFELEPFGGTDFALKAVPGLLARARHADLLRDALDELGDSGQSTRIDEAKDAVLSRMACHGSVRAGDTLTREEVMTLFTRMDEIDFGGNCPHGRPVYFRMGLHEIEQRFDRR